MTGSMEYRSSHSSKGTGTRRTIFARNHPLSYMSPEPAAPIIKNASKSTDSSDDQSSLADPLYVNSDSKQEVLPGFYARGRVTTADRQRRARGVFPPRHTDISRRMNHPVTAESLSHPTLPIPKYLDANGIWLHWPMTEILDLDQIANHRHVTIDEGSRICGDVGCSPEEHAESIWMPNDSVYVDGEIDLPVLDSVTGQPAGPPSLEAVAMTDEQNISLLAYFRGHKYNPPRTPAGAKENSVSLLRVQSPANGAMSLASQIAIGSTSYAQVDPYYYFPAVEEREKRAPTRGGESQRTNSSSVLTKQPSTVINSSETGSRYRLRRNESTANLAASESSPSLESAASVSFSAPPAVRLDKSAIAPALVRLAERTGRDTYMTSDMRRARDSKSGSGVEALRTLKRAYESSRQYPTVLSNALRSADAEPSILQNDVEPVVSSKLYQNVKDAWSGHLVNASGAERKANMLVSTHLIEIEL